MKIYKVTFFLDNVPTSTYKSARKDEISRAIKFFNKWLGARFGASVKKISPVGRRR